jgi:hypothetical protein
MGFVFIGVRLRQSKQCLAYRSDRLIIGCHLEEIPEREILRRWFKEISLQGSLFLASNLVPRSLIGTFLKRPLLAASSTCSGHFGLDQCALNIGIRRTCKVVHWSDCFVKEHCPPCFLFTSLVSSTQLILCYIKRIICDEKQSPREYCQMSPSTEHGRIAHVMDASWLHVQWMHYYTCNGRIAPAMDAWLHLQWTHV